MSDGQLNLTAKARLVRKILRSIKPHSVFLIQTHFAERSYPRDIYNRFQIGSVNLSNLARYICLKMNGNVETLREEAQGLLAGAMRDYTDHAAEIEKQFRAEKKAYRATAIKKGKHEKQE